MIFFSIVKDYTDTPGARYEYQSEFSGEDFRKKHLVRLYERAKNENTVVLIDLDDTYGYPPSFLEEAFGGLARQYPGEDVLSRFQFKSEDQMSLPAIISKMVRDVIGRNDNE